MSLSVTRTGSSVRTHIVAWFALGLVRLCACGGQISDGQDDEGDASVAVALTPLDASFSDSFAMDGAATPVERRDAVVDAPADAAVHDAASDAPDANVLFDARDAGAPPDADLGDAPCLGGVERCNGYVLERCDEQGHWFHPVRHMQCCLDERFVTHDSPAERWIEDTKTGRSWWAYTADATSRSAASTLCPTMFAGGRLPTSAELLSIVLMTPMLDGERVCLPTTDRKFSSSAREYWTTDGCVSLATGLYTGTTCAPDPGYGNPPAVTCIRD